MALIDQLSAAIAKGEGFGVSPSNRPTRNNNPGDITGTGYAGQVGTDPNGFAIFSTPAAGQAALQQYLSQHLAQVGTGVGPYGNLTPNSTLQDFLNIYAGNPDPGYVSTVAQGVGAAPSATLGQLQGMAGAQQAANAAAPPVPASLLDGLDLTAPTGSAGISPLIAVVGAAAAAATLYLLLG